MGFLNSRDGHNIVGAGYLEWEGRCVQITPDQYFDEVPEFAWNFPIVGDQPAQKWLKGRKGRALSFAKHWPLSEDRQNPDRDRPDYERHRTATGLTNHSPQASLGAELLGKAKGRRERQRIGSNGGCIGPSTALPVGRAALHPLRAGQWDVGKMRFPTKCQIG